jgi:hypothetical protein
MAMKRWFAVLVAALAACSDNPGTKSGLDAAADASLAADGGQPKQPPSDAGGGNAFDAMPDPAGAGAAGGNPSDASPNPGLDAGGSGAMDAMPSDAGMDAMPSDTGMDAMSSDTGMDAMSSDAAAHDSGDHDTSGETDAAHWPNATVAENAKAGTASWQLSNPAIGREIEGYASVTSVNGGESLDLFVSTAAPTYTVEIYRLGWYGGLGARLLLAAQTRTGVAQTMPVSDADGMVECHWTQPVTVSTQSTWASGVYLAKLTESTAGKQAFITFVVRDDARDADFLFQSSVNTFQAYNNWGGKSLYDYNSTGMTRASKVSFHRPYGLGDNVESAAGLGAGEVLTNFQGKLQVAAAGWEYSMIRFLEREGFDVSYVTNVDTHRNSELLHGHKAFLSVGHDEYWSWEMRRTVEDGRDRFGTSVGFFSGNAVYWQVRYEPETGPGALSHLVGYKDAPPGDPALGTTDANRTTVRWSTPPLLRPEAALHGLEFQDYGVKADLVVADPEHWIFAGTGLALGDKITGLVGYEVDGIRTYPSPGLLRFAHSPWLSVRGMGMSDMVSFSTPSGADVLALGSIQFAWGLDDFRVSGVVDVAPASTAAQTMARNALLRFTAARPALSRSPIVLDESFAAPRDSARWRRASMSEGASAYDPAIEVTQLGERLQITPLTGASGLHHSGYVSARAFDLTNSSVHVEVVQTTSSASAADTTFAIGLDSDNCYRFTVESGTLVMQRKSAGNVTSQTLAYNPTLHRWWRIRHDQTTNSLYWETSADGASWLTRRSETVTLSPKVLYIEVTAGTYEPESAPGFASFDNVQLELLGISDTFDASRNPEHFTPDVVQLGATAFDPLLPVFGFGGQLHIRPMDSASGAHYGGYASTRAWNFSGARASLEVVQIASGAAQTILAISQSASDYARTLAQSGSLSFQVSVAGVLSSIDVPYDPTTQRFWRIRHDSAANQLVWETGPDAATWNEQRRAACQLALDALRAEILAGTATAQASPGEAIVDNFLLAR